MSEKIRILVAEDHLIARMGVRGVINMQLDMKVVAEATNGEQAEDLFIKHRPDVALLDVRMPKVSGLDAATSILRRDPTARLIALTSFDGDEDVRRALDAGVKAFLTKDVLREELVKAIHAVHAGGSYVPQNLACRLATQQQRPKLSTREIEVLEFVAKGTANKQIAFHLQITEDTVKNHMKNIFSKPGVQDRTEAAIIALQSGILHT